MEFFAIPDWYKLFYPTQPLLETIIRATFIYLALFAILRIVLKREAASLGISDLLVVVLLADAAQNAMSGSYASITDGVILVAVIVFWSYFLDWLGFHYPTFHRLIKPPHLILVKKGRFIYRNMKKELVTKSELLSEMRTQGIKDLDNIEEAYMEPDGRISIITKSLRINQSPRRKRIV